MMTGDLRVVYAEIDGLLSAQRKAQEVLTVVSDRLEVLTDELRPQPPEPPSAWFAGP